LGNINKIVLDIFLGKHKAPNHKTLVENMHKTFRNMGCNRTLKLYFLLSYLVIPSPFPKATLVMSVTRILTDSNKIPPPWKNDTKRIGGQQCLPTTAGN
jgi:hypothetical protein